MMVGLRKHEHIKESEGKNRKQGDNLREGRKVEGNERDGINQRI